MLNVGPWNRLPLTIQWLKQEHQQDFPISKPPPMHMPIAYGPLRVAKKATQEQQKADDEVKNMNINVCYFCNENKVC